MLTKDLLRVRSRSGKLLPEFIPAGSQVEMSLAEDLIQTARESVGTQSGEARASISDLAHGSVKSAAGLAKLVIDRLEVAEPEDEAAEKRWLVFLQAEKIRESTASRAEFESAVTKASGKIYSELSTGLYSDLGDARAVVSFKDIKPEALIDRYNLALVQSLLLRAESVIVRLKKSTLAERRRVFRALRFHRLMPLELGGPLSIFGAANLYGMCIANFIPHLFLSATWELEASILLKNKKQTLKLTEKSGLVSHYKLTGSWMPEEFSAFGKAFAARASEWQIESTSDPLILGNGQWCLPDFTFKNSKGLIVHLELFHKWHAGALSARVNSLAGLPRKDLILGICRQLIKNKEVVNDVEKLKSISHHTLLFTEFPTPVAVLSKLKEIAE